MKYVIYLISTFALVGCASGGQRMSDSKEPLYLEKSEAMSVEEFRAATCPSGEKWQSENWKKVVSYANGCVKAGDWNKVEDLANHLATQAHLTPWGPYFLSLAASARKDIPRATWMLELALKKAPKEGIFHYELGRIYWQSGDEAMARKHLSQASDLSPTLVEAHWIMAQLAVYRNDLSDAQKRLEKALAQDSKHWPSLMTMATVKIKRQAWSEAETLLERAVQMKPKSSKARLALAWIQEEHLKKLTEALRAYKEIKRLSADHKLDESLPMNVDEKIKVLESQQMTARQPTTDKKAVNQ